MNETATRFATAFVLIPFVIAAMVYGSIYWATFVGAVALLTISEYLNLIAAKGFEPFRKESYLATIALIAAAYFLGDYALTLVLTVIILSVFFAQLYRKTVATAIANVAVTIAGIVYIPWLLAHGVFLRELTYGNDWTGFYFVLQCLATTFMADTGAYFAGRQFGKTPIAPTISPKKTWEGLAGGVVAASAGGALVCYLFQQHVGPTQISVTIAAVIGGLNAVFGFAGDLSESVLKRDADVKDSGNLLPGHGGFLDRIDAVLFNIPFNYHLIRLIVGPF